jgi:prepilin-type N-terminal cleavage/methylation domain-containing protein/prepilin-type processing-associated H-X9-DG protein
MAERPLKNTIKMKKFSKALTPAPIYIEMTKLKKQSKLLRLVSKILNHRINRCRGFTLIELLVVISIISLLLMFLLPALNKTKNNAWKIVCSRNLGQISLAMSGYANDYKGIIIKANEVVFVPSVEDVEALWNIVLLPYVSKEITPTDFFENSTKIWFCPADDDPYPRGFLNNPHPGMTSFALNGYYENRSGREIKLGPAGGYTISQIKQPSDCMLMGETSYAAQFYDAQHPAVKAISPPIRPYGHHRMTSGFYHGNSMNVIYVDGHISSIKGIQCSKDARFIPSNYASGRFMFWPELTLPDAEQEPVFWGPGYKN